METHGGRKVLVTLLGVVAGLCVAILLQQAGAVPFDRLSAFGFPALVGGLAFVAIVARTGFARAAAEWVMIIIIIVLLIIAALGVPALAADGELGGSTGYLDGGCTVEASSDLETKRGVPTMHRSDPFDVDPDGTVSWEATSDGPIMDHTWNIYVHAAGFKVRIDDDGDPNEKGDTGNSDTEQVRPYADNVASRIGGDLVGIFLVSGDIEGEGGACDGQAWVRIEGSVLSNYVGQGALVLLLLLVIIIIVVIVRTGRAAAGGIAPDGGPGEAPFDDVDYPPGAMQ